MSKADFGLVLELRDKQPSTLSENLIELLFYFGRTRLAMVIADKNEARQFIVGGFYKVGLTRIGNDTSKSN